MRQSYLRWALAGASLLAALVVGEARATTVARSVFGTAADGQTVDLITLRNHHGMTVRFSTRGGSITEISAPDRKGVVKNLVTGHPDFQAWEMGGNAIVGRYANRIGGGGFSIDGVFYKLGWANPTTKVALHGGPVGFTRRLWKAETFTRGDRAGAILSYDSPDGENDFPGEVKVDVTYSLGEDNVLRLEFNATTTKPTVINLTSHTGFNMGGFDSGPVYDQRLQVFASHYTPADENLVPTGEIAPVKGTPFDFLRPTRIGEKIYAADPQLLFGKGYDHNFVLDKPAGNTGPALAVRLSDPKTGRRLDVRTTEPGVQIYSSNGDNGTRVGAPGRVLRQSDFLAIETQHFPDSPNKPNFPSTVLRPGKPFHSVTEFAFFTDAAPERKK